MLFKSTGISAYDLMHDGSKFDNAFTRPSFMATADVSKLKEIINRICGMCELSVIVPDSATDTEVATAVITAVQNWSLTNKALFEKIHELYSAQYNPLDNYDRTELTHTVSDSTTNATNTSTGKSTDTGTSNGTTTDTSNGTTTGTSTGINTANSADNGTSENASTSSGKSASDSESKIMPIDGSESSDMVTTGGGSGNSTNDSDSYGTAKNQSEHSESAVNQSENASTTQNRQDITNQTTSNSANEYDNSSTGKTETGGSTSVSSRIHGNIGVMTTQSMLEAESKLRAAFQSDLRYIAESFKAEMVLGYYAI